MLQRDYLGSIVVATAVIQLALRFLNSFKKVALRRGSLPWWRKRVPTKVSRYESARQGLTEQSDQQDLPLEALELSGYPRASSGFNGTLNHKGYCR